MGEITKIPDKSKKTRWLLIITAFIINFIVIGLIFLMLAIFWGEINLLVSDFMGFYFNVVLLVSLMLIISPLIYGSILLGMGLRNKIKNQEKRLHLAHKIAILIITLIIDMSFIVLIFSMASYTKVLVQMVEFYSMGLIITIFIILLSLTHPIALRIKRMKLNDKTFLSSIILIILIASHAIVLIVPYTFQPAQVIEDELPHKPRLMGHRGAAHLAPENTIAAGERMLDYDVTAWEIDIRLTKEGIPILLHDQTLKRTTNVDEVFPERVNDDVDSFSLAELKQLDAGSWFVEKDPYSAIIFGKISEEQAQGYIDEKIPTFAEALQFSIENDIQVYVDFKSPSKDNDFADNYFEIIINTILDSGIDLTNILLEEIDKKEYQYLESKSATDMLLPWNFISTSADEIKTSNYECNFVKTSDELTNEEYRTLHANNINVCVYTHDSIERFSQLWSMGVDWVMVNDVHVFSTFESPLFYMQKSIYHAIWNMIDIVALLALCLILFVTFKSE